MNRALFNIILFLSLFLLNWWLFLVLLLFGVFLFGRFYEATFYALAYDLIFAAGGVSFYQPYITTIVSILFLVISEHLKKYLKFYGENV